MPTSSAGSNHRAHRRRTATATAAATAAAVPVARFVDLERPAFELLAVQLLNRLLRIGVGAHLDKAEAAGLSGGPIGDDGDRLAHARLSEQLFEILGGDVES